MLLVSRLALAALTRERQLRPEKDAEALVARVAAEARGRGSDTIRYIDVLLAVGRRDSHPRAA